MKGLSDGQREREIIDCEADTKKVNQKVIMKYSCPTYSHHYFFSFDFVLRIQGQCWKFNIRVKVQSSSPITQDIYHREHRNEWEWWFFQR